LKRIIHGPVGAGDYGVDAMTLVNLPRRLLLLLVAALLVVVMAVVTAGPALADPGKGQGLGGGNGAGDAYNLDNGKELALGGGAGNNPHNNCGGNPIPSCP
jgi:hypothetical protein